MKKGQLTVPAAADAAAFGLSSLVCRCRQVYRHPETGLPGVAPGRQHLASGRWQEADGQRLAGSAWWVQTAQSGLVSAGH